MSLSEPVFPLTIDSDQTSKNCTIVLDTLSHKLAAPRGRGGRNSSALQNLAGVKLSKEEENEQIDHFIREMCKEVSLLTRRALMRCCPMSSDIPVFTNWEDVGSRHFDRQLPKD
jgi:hypothetical protein